jgi:hypothetical protein
LAPPKSRVIPSRWMKLPIGKIRSLPDDCLVRF